jgi:hypothetical protein
MNMDMNLPAMCCRVAVDTADMVAVETAGLPPHLVVAEITAARTGMIDGVRQICVERGVSVASTVALATLAFNKRIVKIQAGGAA